MGSSENRVQFCRGDQDITADMNAESDATEVRVWSGDDLVIVAVAESGGVWRYAASDYGPDPGWDLDGEFASWSDALDAFGVDFPH